MTRFLRSARAAGVVLVTTLAAACGDGGTEVTTFEVPVQVQYPATYASAAAAGARVLLTSVERSTSDTAVADAQGIARFARVLPGSYVVSATRTLTADEAQTLTGQRLPLTLNSVEPSRSILTAPSSPVATRLAGSRLGDLVIKEVSFTGSRTPSGGTYFSD